MGDQVTLTVSKRRLLSAVLLGVPGIVLGFMSFLRNVPRSLLGCSLFLAFVSLFFSVLAD